MLVVPSRSESEPLLWSNVTRHNRGDVLASGLIDDEVALFRAAQFGVAGIVAGSMSSALASLCQTLSLRVILTEGLGTMPMAAAAFASLRQHQGRMVILSGGKTTPRTQPELIIPLPEASGTPSLPAVVTSRVGRAVRLTRQPYLGATATVVMVPTQPQHTAAGTLAEGAVVSLPNGQRVFVPWVNMEMFS